MNRRFIVATALLVPALAFVSCKDDGNSNPIEPQIPSEPQAVKRVTPQPTSAQIKKVQTLLNASGDFSTMNLPNAKHDPAVLGQAVQCFDGAEVTGAPGTGDPFRPQADAVRGCELNTMGHPSGTANAFAATRLNRIRGKRLAAVEHINFDFAGGMPSGGTPRWSIPIDDDGDGTFEFSDPDDEQYAFIDALGCNDGDAFVGRLAGEDDPTCLVTYKGVTYPNWDSFEAAWPAARIATRFSGTFGFQRADPFVILDQEAHYLVFRFRLD